MSTYTTLFEQQSYKDALDFYLAVLSDGSIPTWDYVILTAGNEEQAKEYRLQIEHRIAHFQLPSATHYAVIPDLNGMRIGSGGATFSCLKYVYEREHTFFGKKILVIHSGGDSKRVPQYSACGKLFSPVPRVLPDGRRSTLFDEFMIGMAGVASRISDGMLVCSGDVLLLFNVLQIDFCGTGATALSIKEEAETGKNHGVFLCDNDGNVGRFLHKQTVESLKAVGAADRHGNVDIDTGAVIMSSDMLFSLYSLIDTDEKYHRFVNEKARVSFYADFLYPLASRSDLDSYYKEKPEGDYTDELHNCRTEIWNVLHRYRMKMIRLSPASFIHFGTTRELLNLMTDGIDKYRFLGWKSVIGSNINPENYAVSNSYISRKSSIGEGSYIEDSRIHHGSKVGRNCIISGVTLSGESVPDNTVLHGLKLNDGRFVCRMYGVNDNPKENKLFEKEIDGSLWNAKIYPVCDTMEEAVSSVLSGKQNGELTNLNDSFNNADVTAILPWQEKLREQVAAETVLEMIDSGTPAEEVKKIYTSISDTTVRYLLDKAAKLSVESLSEFSRLIRIYGYLWKLTENGEMFDNCFGAICKATLEASENGFSYNDKLILKNDITVNLPVRVNWGGAWTDTPPYCMENGGTVLNAAISLNGQLPIEASVKRLNKPVIALASTDIGAYKEFDDIKELQNCKNPSDPFALHKAALIICGVIPHTEEISVKEICDRLGGGLYVNTRVINIPKGSGLGTSSILAGACVKAIFGAMGETPADDEIFERVLCMEQLMSTGGGWQDQVGGISPGIKMITTRPGLRQHITCKPCNIDKDTINELNERLVLIYTGQRRLARNLLRDVVSRYICNNPESLSAHYNIQRLAVLMRFELEKGNVDGFARLLNEHWEESKRIDSGSTNTCIDQIFLTIDDLIDGKMICGAGGGGFLQAVLKKGVTREMLSERLYDVFRDSGVCIWNCKIVHNG